MNATTVRSNVRRIKTTTKSGANKVKVVRVKAHKRRA
jgi:hypothetical protein